jgi:predicted peptidase
MMGSLFLSGSLYAQDNAEAFQKRVYKSKEGILNYRIYTPEKMDNKKKYPLIIFFHGAGGRGNDNNGQLANGIKDLLEYSKTSGNPAIITVPQCPKGERWADISFKSPVAAMTKDPSSPMRLVIELLKDTVSKLPVDKERIYVTGLSMGGYGTWDIVQRMPDTFAAAMPVCGRGDTKMAAAIKDIPIWVFHGGADSVVNPKFSQDMVAALKDVGSKVKYTEYKDVGHDSWTKTYTDKEVLKWLFDQKKNK